MDPVESVDVVEVSHVVDDGHHDEGQHPRAPESIERALASVEQALENVREALGTVSTGIEDRHEAEVTENDEAILNQTQELLVCEKNEGLEDAIIASIEEEGVSFLDEGKIGDSEENEDHQDNAEPQVEPVQLDDGDKNIKEDGAAREPEAEVQRQDEHDQSEEVHPTLVEEIRFHSTEDETNIDNDSTKEVVADAPVVEVASAEQEMDHLIIEEAQDSQDETAENIVLEEKLTSDPEPKSAPEDYQVEPDDKVEMESSHTDQHPLDIQTEPSTDVRPDENSNPEPEAGHSIVVKQEEMVRPEPDGECVAEEDHHDEDEDGEEYEEVVGEDGVKRRRKKLLRNVVDELSHLDESKEVSEEAIIVNLVENLTLNESHETSQVDSREILVSQESQLEEKGENITKEDFETDQPTQDQDSGVTSVEQGQISDQKEIEKVEIEPMSTSTDKDEKNEDIEILKDPETLKEEEKLVEAIESQGKQTADILIDDSAVDVPTASSNEPQIVESTLVEKQETIELVPAPENSPVPAECDLTEVIAPESVLTIDESTKSMEDSFIEIQPEAAPEVEQVDPNPNNGSVENPEADLEKAMDDDIEIIAEEVTGPEPIQATLENSSSSSEADIPVEADHVQNGIHEPAKGSKAMETEAEVTTHEVEAVLNGAQNGHKEDTEEKAATCKDDQISKEDKEVKKFDVTEKEVVKTNSSTERLTRSEAQTDKSSGSSSKCVIS